MVVTIHAAKTQLSKLIEAALAGEDVVIARGKEPLVRIVPLVQTSFKMGVLDRALCGPGPDFFAPLDEAETALWEGGA